MPTFYAVVNVLRYDPDTGKLMFSDNDSDFEEVTPTVNTGNIKQGNLIVWMAGKGISMITDISYEDEFKDYFAKGPKPKYGGSVWIAKLKNNAPIGVEMKYSISFKPKNGDIITVDPKTGSDPGP